MTDLIDRLRSFHAILVDNGVMRLNECENVKKMLGDHMGINIKVSDASNLFLGRLKGVTDPEKKRKIIGNTFIEVFEAEAALIDKECGGKIEYLLQGTLYPDVIESISFKGPSATIKTHHNVGGLLEDMKLKLIEPLRELFKDEVRALGKILGLDDELVWRHPFPGPGIAIRILGEVTKEQVEIARLADHIYIEEIKKNGYYRQISQAYAALLPVKAVGVMGDKRTYEQVIALRAVETKDFMTADIFASAEWFMCLKRISSRIINEVKGVNRVVYDISSKPPATVSFTTTDLDKLTLLFANTIWRIFRSNGSKEENIIVCFHFVSYICRIVNFINIKPALLSASSSFSCPLTRKRSIRCCKEEEQEEE